MYRSFLLLIVIICLAPFSGENAVRAKEQYTTRNQWTDTTKINGLIATAKTFQQKRPDTAINLLSRALRYSRDLKYYTGICRTLNSLGVSYDIAGQSREALQCYKEALRYSLSIPALQQFAGYLCNNIAITYSKTGASDQAVQYYYYSLVADRLLGGNNPTGMILCNLGGELNNLGFFDRALFYLRDAEKIAVTSRDADLLAGTLINQGIALSRNLQVRYWSSARPVMERALAVAGKNGLRSHQSEVYGSLGIVYSRMRQYGEAIQYLLRSKEYNDADPYQKIFILINLAEAYLSTGNQLDAKKNLIEAQHLAITTRSKNLADIYQALGKLYSQMGDYHQAIENYERYQALKDSSRDTRALEKVHELEAQLQHAERSKELMSKELVITQQKSLIQRKNLQFAAIAVATILLAVFSAIVYRNRRRTQLQLLEIATWRAKLDGEERERQRLARELHDGIGGSLSTVKMWLGTIRADNSELRHAADFNEALQLLSDTLEEVRETAHNLMPELLFKYGLADAVRIYCSNIQRASQLHIEYQYLGYLDKMEGHFELMVYRIIQELVQNIIKHARASFAVVQLSHHDQTLCVTVEDNGIGMDTASGTEGIGLQNTRTNVARLGGFFSLRSQPGDGTTVYIELPIQNQQP